ncbi:MAG TPA: hypothetical protein VGI65_02650 [Steroidobacteraceae bacterium]
MDYKLRVAAGTVFIAVSLSVTVPSAADSAAARDARPDLEGTWTNASLTRLERPSQYGDRKILTAKEAEAIEKKNSDLVALGNKPTDPKATVKDLPADCSDGRGNNCNYNAAWTDPGDTVMRVHGEPRSSFIIFPVNGRLPAFTAEAIADGSAVRRYGPPLPPGLKMNDNPETRALGERCLTSFAYSAGPVMLPLLYNNVYKIVQGKDNVAIVVEMVHDVRIIRLNAVHRADGLRPWFGDSVGHYEGGALVVETTNFPQSQPFLGSWKNLKVTERFSRDGTDHILYQFKVEDPTVWTQAWSGEYEFSKAGGMLYEYACHEGNYALPGILAGARAEEAAAAEKAGIKAVAAK